MEGHDSEAMMRLYHLPVAPNIFPLGNSHMPAINCARPPQNMAMPTTAFGATIWRVPALNKESINVVDAKEKSPLKRVSVTDSSS